MGKSRRQRDRGWPEIPDPLPLPVPDNHTHLDSVLRVRANLPGTASPALGDAIRPGEEPPPAMTSMDDHLAWATAANIPRMVQVGCDLASVAWTDAVLRADADGVADQAEADDMPIPMPTGRRSLLGAVAIHPNEAVLHAGIHEVAPDGLDPDPQPWHDHSLEDALAEVARVAESNDRVRAIGETGLDFFRAGPRGREIQREAFRAQIALAKELGLALQIHDRDAHREVVEILHRDGAPERTVFHCFSGGPPLAEICASEGWYCSFAGPVTFGTNHDLRAALRLLPDELLLVETDAPYLTAHPARGRPNAPYLIPLTVRRIAEERGAELPTMCRTLATTTERVYGTW